MVERRRLLILAGRASFRATSVAGALASPTNRLMGPRPLRAAIAADELHRPKRLRPPFPRCWCATARACAVSLVGGQRPPRRRSSRALLARGIRHLSRLASAREAAPPPHKPQRCKPYGRELARPVARGRRAQTSPAAPIEPLARTPAPARPSIPGCAPRAAPAFRQETAAPECARAIAVFLVTQSHRGHPHARARPAILSAIVRAAASAPA